MQALHVIPYLLLALSYSELGRVTLLKLLLLQKQFEPINAVDDGIEISVNSLQEDKAYSSIL